MSKKAEVIGEICSLRDRFQDLGGSDREIEDFDKVIDFIEKYL